MSLLRKIIVKGLNYLGAYEDVGVNDKSINVGDFLLLVAEGKIPGKSMVHKFGKNESVTTGSFQAIWTGGGAYTGFPSTADTVTVTSSSANDTAAGTGLRTVRLYGLDVDFLEQTEDIILNGLTPVTSTLSYIRLNRVRGLTAGTTQENEGAITVAQSLTPAVIFAVMPIGYNTTMIAAYTIPALKKGYVLSQAASIADKNASVVDVRLKVRTPGAIFTVNGEVALNSVGTGFIEKSFRGPLQLAPKTDFFIEATASATVAVSAFIDILLVDE